MKEEYDEEDERWEDCAEITALVGSIEPVQDCAEVTALVGSTEPVKHCAEFTGPVGSIEPVKPRVRRVRGYNVTV